LREENENGDNERGREERTKKKEKERQIKKSSASVPKLAKELGKKFLVLRKGGSERRLRCHLRPEE
jgi:hypothetical protein